MSDCLHCDGLSRSRLLRKAIAEAGRGLPAIEPGMPLPAGHGALAAAASSRTGSARRSRCTAPRGSACRRSRRASRRRRPAAAAGVRLGVPRGRRGRRSRCCRRRAIRSTGSCARRSASRAARRSPRIRGSSGIRRRAGSRSCTASSKVTVMPAVGYTHPEPVALHVAPLLGGRRDRHAAEHRLARPLPRRGRHDGQPAPGRLVRRHARAGARDREGAGRGDRRRRPVRLLLQPGLGRGGGRGCSSRSGCSASRRDPALRDGAAASRARSTGCASSCCRSAQDGKPGYTSPVTYPTVGRRLPEAARRPRRDDRRRVAAARRRALGAGRVRHALERGAARSTQGLQLTSDTLLAFQRDLEARGARRPRARARLVGVRAPRAGERLSRHRPRRRRRRLPRRHAREGDRWSASSRASRRSGLDADGNVIATVDFRSVYCVAARAVARRGRGEGRDPGRVGSFQAPALIA